MYLMTGNPGFTYDDDEDLEPGDNDKDMSNLP